MEADATTTVDGVARGGRQMSPLLLPVPLAADAGVPGAQAPREEWQTHCCSLLLAL